MEISYAFILQCTEGGSTVSNSKDLTLAPNKNISEAIFQNQGWLILEIFEITALVLWHCLYCHYHDHQNHWTMIMIMFIMIRLMMITMFVLWHCLQWRSPPFADRSLLIIIGIAAMLIMIMVIIIMVMWYWAQWQQWWTGIIIVVTMAIDDYAFSSLSLAIVTAMMMNLCHFFYHPQYDDRRW